MVTDKKVKEKSKKAKSVYLKISPSTMTYKKLMEKAEREKVDWEKIARTLLNKGLLNL